MTRKGGDIVIIIRCGRVRSGIGIISFASILSNHCPRADAFGRTARVLAARRRRKANCGSTESAARFNRLRRVARSHDSWVRTPIGFPDRRTTDDTLDSQVLDFLSFENGMSSSQKPPVLYLLVLLQQWRMLRNDPGVLLRVPRPSEPAAQRPPIFYAQYLTDLH